MTFTVEQQVDALEWLITENATNNPQAITDDMARSIIASLLAHHAELEAAQEEIDRLENIIRVRQERR